MRPLFQSSVPCREMVLKAEMCLTQQVGDDMVEDISEPQFWKEQSWRRDVLVLCEVQSWEEQRWPVISSEAR
jgi:hypothetical protein